MSLRLQIVSKHKESMGPNHTRDFVGCGGTIGRSLDNDWALPDVQRYLSARHAMIDCQGSTFYLLDTSRNGVFLNGSDIPIGNGNPQKLKDGDTLRMGDYEFKAEIAIDGRISADDGMRDSIVRAQLVEEDSSVEMPLLHEDNMSDMTLSDHLKISEPEKSHDTASDTNSQKIAAASHDAMLNEAVNILLKAAGMDAQELSARAAEDMLDQAGAIIKEYTAGLTGLSMSRSDFVERYHLAGQTTHEDLSNPLRLVTGMKETLNYLLTTSIGKSMAPEAAVRDIFRDLAFHQRAMVKAISIALDDYIGHFNPESIEKEFSNDNAKTGNFLEQYAKAFDKLTKDGDTELPAPFNDEFVRAYADELRTLKANGKR
jgi:predicted component of type VI protein secretion system